MMRRARLPPIPVHAGRRDHSGARFPANWIACAELRARTLTERTPFRDIGMRMPWKACPARSSCMPLETVLHLRTRCLWPAAEAAPESGPARRIRRLADAPGAEGRPVGKRTVNRFRQAIACSLHGRWRRFRQQPRKSGLQRRSDEFGLKISTWHFPSGANSRNRTEDLLSCRITRHSNGRIQVSCNFIAAHGHRGKGNVGHRRPRRRTVHRNSLDEPRRHWCKRAGGAGRERQVRLRLRTGAKRSKKKECMAGSVAGALRDA